jgi:mannose-6-phosphate isomerase-like protein (cupin superfamily)
MKMNRKTAAAFLLSIGIVTGPAIAQDAAKTPDTYSPETLMAMEKTLAQKADASGLVSQPIKKYSTDYTLLVFRNQSGKPELHEKFADFYFVVDGSATLVSGGQMVNAKTTAPGEVRGDSIQDGKETKLKKGDIVHIPADIPHQLTLAKGDTFQYFVIKVQEVN